MSKKPDLFRKKHNALLHAVINARIYDLVRETPLSLAANLSAISKNKVFLKREDLQPVFSFKIRGAYHKMTRLSPSKLINGVVAVSAGNHAQGVALAAKKLHCPAAIVMPQHTQQIKIAAVKSYGAQVILHGDCFDDSLQRFARQLAKEKGAVFIPPFDDADIIAGNGTIAAEILRQHPAPLEAIFCAIGGGGLISGIAAYVKALRPQIKIIGVEAQESASMSASLKAGRRVQLSQVGTFADAVAVKKPGALPFEITQRLVDDVIVVSNDELCAAIKELYEDTRVIFEPGGALAVAGLKNYTAAHKWRGKNIVAVACGANMNFDRLRFIAERADIGEKREALFAVTIDERPGSFRKFCAILGKRSVTEFNYRFGDPDSAHIFVGIETPQKEERKTILQKLRKAGLTAVDMTDNEMAKLHIRHLVGGRRQMKDEILYRFEFPERPGALMNFLDMLGQSTFNWNISLFHYRNHGADTGRVLVGMQVPLSQRSELPKFLKTLNYPYICESDNPAYRLFL